MKAGEFYTRQCLLGTLTLLQAAFVVYLLSFLSISPGDPECRMERSVSTALSLFLFAAARLMIRRGMCGGSAAFALFFVAHLLFNLTYFADFPAQISVHRGSFLILSRVNLHLSVLLNIVNCLVSAAYLAFFHVVVLNATAYTEASGLLAFCGDALARLFREVYSVFIASSVGGSAFVLLYFALFRFAFHFLGVCLRTTIVYTSILEIIGCLVVASISNVLFFFACGLLDSLMVYNRSFADSMFLDTGYLEKDIHHDKKSYDKKNDDKKNEMDRYRFHQVALFSKTRTAEPSKYAYVLKDMDGYFGSEMGHLSAILERIRSVRTDYDGCAYVTVPQVKRNFSKKIRTYNLYEMARSYVISSVSMFVLRAQYAVAYGNVLKIVELFARLKKRDNRVRMPQALESGAAEALERIVSLERAYGIALDSARLENALLDLSNKI